MDLSSHLLPKRIERSEYANTHYSLTVQRGVTPQHVIEPDFWQHVVARLQINDRIEVTAADGSFDMDLRVIAIDSRGLYAQVRVLRFCDSMGVPVTDVLKPSAETVVGRYPDDEGYSVEFDRVHRWRILRGRELIEKGFPDEASAIAALIRIKGAKPKAA